MKGADKWCSTCRYWLRKDSENCGGLAIGECRQYAPGLGCACSPDWPLVYANDFCGMWKKVKANTPPDT